MKFIESKSKAYRTKGAVNKKAQEIEAKVNEIETSILGYSTKKLVGDEDKGKIIQPATVGMAPQVNPNHDPKLIDAGEMHRWLTALIKLKDEDKKFSADARQIMKEIKDYIERQQVKQ